MRRKKGHKKSSFQILNVTNHPMDLNANKKNEEHVSSPIKIKISFEAMNGTLNMSNDETKDPLQFNNGTSNASTLINLNDWKSNVDSQIDGKLQQYGDSQLLHHQEVIDRYVHKTQNLQMENIELTRQIEKMEVELNTINEVGCDNF
jgi:hypothetical protein